MVRASTRKTDGGEWYHQEVVVGVEEELRAAMMGWVPLKEIYTDFRFSWNVNK